MKYLIGNHKMNANKKELAQYLKDLRKLSKTTNNVVGVCAPYPYLDMCSKLLKGSKVRTGAQNMSDKQSGAYTGEVSASMLKDFGVSLVIVGHSERRELFNETDNDVNSKVIAAINAGLTPILCFGESLQDKNNGNTKKVIRKQLVNAIKGLDAESLNNMYFAYEPIWAIGTGLSATAKEADSVIKYCKQVVAKQLLVEDITKVVMLYGGSLNSKNVDELLLMPNIDGGLIGGASLKINDFKSLVTFN